ncbi:uncharacterized protein FFUJ_02272 [Fusarium fujikuroi IMI 58289]|uniref:Uncharacterized protein n=1 Tax=Gibberella fujikuroi (strain CBS 195.34 / IMI 58289 / NRRL A-6831) TaxID=1279085 RepID=S0DVB1_GIBF5|nr:uncharacterized protein FFUJ_02272 [Fusarium fujikuroi IMI 58289]CCT65337.1 uncharacterized protein FFUJ_02272 [Fusarium fujikuroi IMI 58289]SCO24154.1 uncharacterized protein FFM5_13574 [Fusarium fujikuroi]SCO34914.1 uncharacterized protein FFMR_03682 [Fusarium fujikuroi]
MFRIFAVIFLHLTGICLAQNSSLPKDCPIDIRRIDEGYLIYNSTRTARARFARQNRPWYITASVTDRRGPNIVFGDVDTLQEVGVFISVHKTLADPRYPAGRDIRLCSSMLKASNRTSENPPDIDAPENITYAKHSCKGVISEKCIREFENATYTATGRPRKCPGLQSLDFSDECKEYIGHSQTIPRNFSSARCSVDKMPYVDLPEDYITFDIGLGVGIFGDEDRKDFDTYDLRVQQTIPLLFSASPGAGKNTLICIAPDQVIPGSRKPQLELEGEAEEPEEDEEPEDDENLASRVGGLGASVFLGVGAIIFSLL